MRLKHLIKSLLTAAFSVTAITAVSAAESAKDITIRTELGQASYHTEKGTKAHIRIDLEGIRHQESERTPINIAIVIDKSGSMNGNKLEQAKEAAIMAVERLNEDDYVSIITYSDDVNVLIPSRPVTDYSEFRRKIRAIRTTGRTALYAGTKRGIDELDHYFDEHRVNRVILLSDGLANVGPSKPSDLERLGQQAAAKGISVTTIGLGLGFNEDLMTKLAYASDGNHAFVRHERDLVDIFNKEFGDVLSVVAQDVIIIIECANGFRPMRVMGRAAKIEGQKVHLKLNQLYAAQEKNIILEIELKEVANAGTTPIADISIDYRSMASKQRTKLQDKANATFTDSKQQAEGSINKRVMSSVVEYIATERNEEAVALRDKGKIKEARKVLQGNASYLENEAKKLGGTYAPTLNSLAKKNKMDSENLAEDKWTASRKAMKARQYKQKTQQSY